MGQGQTMKKIILIGLLMCGCAGREPMSYEQRMTLASVGAAMQDWGNRPQNVYVQPQYYTPPVWQPQQMPSYQPTFYQIDTPGYQRANGASAGQIHY
jgi:hypothetical protein